MNSNLQIEVLLETPACIVINKPAGLVVNRAESVKTATLQDWIEEQSWYIHHDDDNYRSRSGLVHRLDKETSGALVIAKHPASLEELQRQFHDREVEKTYLALVHGDIEVESATVVLPIGRSTVMRGRFVVDPHGRPSETTYEVVDRYKDGDQAFSLVRLYPKTGRTHQIRVHMKHIGHPLVADPLYLGKHRTQQDRAWCPRQFLHAEQLHFTDPDQPKKISVSAPLSADLQTVLDRMNRL